MRFAAGVVGAILFAAPGLAQSALKPDEMVKVELRSDEVLRGKVLRPTRDSLFFSDYARVLAIPAADIRSVATFEKDWWRGARRGAKVGAITGGVLVVAGLAADLTYCRQSGSECMAPFTAIGLGAAFWTTGIGAGIGFLTAPGGWSRPRPYAF
jgi:hypothetical protein